MRRAVLIGYLASLLACGKSRADADRERAEALAAQESKQRAEAAAAEAAKRRDEEELERTWKVREPIVRQNLADAKRLAAAGHDRTARGYGDSARAALDLFANKTSVVSTKAWVELDAEAASMKKALDAQLVKPPSPIERAPDDPKPVLARYKCHDGAMVKQVAGFDPCILAAQLEVCMLGPELDNELIELGAIGCIRTYASKDSVDVCCRGLP